MQSFVAEGYCDDADSKDLVGTGNLGNDWGGTGAGSHAERLGGPRGSRAAAHRRQ